MKKIGELINEKFRINQEQSKNLQEENESLKTLKDDFTIIKEKFGELEKKGSVDEEYKKQIFSKLETMVEKAVTEKMPVPQTPITPKTPA
jgi:uncharacterized protein YjgD (DUF1641 family)